MKKSQILLITLVCIATFIFVYSPHLNYQFPLHIDEFHHITESIKLGKGEYIGGPWGYELGFHVVLLMISGIINLVLSYKYLPAIWAVLSSLTLFYVVHKKTKNFKIALFAMIFFASIKSNVNMSGLWFFTPLSFAIPFIFLYVYFFTEGIEKQNKKSILISLAIMAFLLFVHPLSFLFAIPSLVIYALINIKYLKKEYKFFSLFLIIPLVGFLFFIYTSKVQLSNAISLLASILQFGTEFGVIKYTNSFLDIYSIIGYLAAIAGILVIYLSKKSKRFSAYMLWPATLLISIFIYRLTGLSYFSPHQRNIYYFAISLPILSAIGLFYILSLIKKVKLNNILKKTIYFTLLIIVLFFTFSSYFNIPKVVEVYHVIDNNDYQALLFLSNLPKSRVIALPLLSAAIYPISGHEPVATVYFYEKSVIEDERGDFAFFGDKKQLTSYASRNELYAFFSLEDCKVKHQIFNMHRFKYILSKEKIDCGWDLIYQKNNYIYQTY
jgi:hypothetical protein